MNSSTSLTTKRKVVVVGVGIMGNGIALNFLKNGYKVIVWNRTNSKLANLKKLGAEILKTPKEAAQQADLIFEVSANDESSQKIWLGKDGILAGADKNKILITCATLSIDWTDKLAKECAKRKFTFFDMPMTGSRQAAEGGSLFLLVGGNAQKLKTIEPDLKAIAQKVTYFGKAGFGMRFKLLLNTLQAIHGVAFGEIINLASATGQDVKKVGEFLSDRPGGTVTKMALEQYLNPPKTINFSLDWMTKDLRYTKKMAKSNKTPLLDDALNKLEQGVKKKMGSKNWTEVNKIS